MYVNMFSFLTDMRCVYFVHTLLLYRPYCETHFYVVILTRLRFVNCY